MPPKTRTAAEAVATIPDGSFVYISGNAATPGALVRALAARTDIQAPIRLGHVLMLGTDPFAAGVAAGRFRHHAWFVGPADRGAVNAGQADYVPVHLHQIPRVIAEGPPLDAALLSASPPDRHGHMSLGVETMASLAALRRARQVIVQVNPRMPRVLGDGFLHLEDVDVLVEAAEDLPELTPSPASPVQQAIADHIVPLVPPAATLQLGIGGIPDAVLRRLCQTHRDLGVHTEMISDGLVDAVEAGAITGDAKTLHPGKVIITFAMGTRRLYDFIEDNPLIEAHPCDYVNRPHIIAQNDRMVAINAALSVDLTGQVCSDSIGTQIYSGFGGQVDFLRGAAASQGGVPIIALPATAQGGRISRIVPCLAEGSGVVTSRADVHWVVTEHGAVNLLGQTLQERARRLISIAAPEHRDTLARAAHQRWGGRYG